MPTINYEAKRSVTGGRSIGSNYNLTLKLVKQDRKPKRKTSVATSLSGRRFETFLRLDVFYEIQTAPESDTSTLDQTREFLDSCAGGEAFTMDGANFVIDGDYAESLVELSGFYTFSFRVLKQ